MFDKYDRLRKEVESKPYYLIIHAILLPLYAVYFIDTMCKFK